MTDFENGKTEPTALSTLTQKITATNSSETTMQAYIKNKLTQGNILGVTHKEFEQLFGGDVRIAFSIAKQLAFVLFVPADTVAIDQGNEVGGCVARQRRAAEVRPDAQAAGIGGLRGTHPGAPRRRAAHTDQPQFRARGNPAAAPSRLASAAAASGRPAPSAPDPAGPHPESNTAAPAPRPAPRPATRHRRSRKTGSGVISLERIGNGDARRISMWSAVAAGMVSGCCRVASLRCASTCRP